MQPYGSKRKLRPYGSRPAQPDPLTDIHAQIEHLISEQAVLVAEELRLFKIVDKYDLRGKRDLDEAYNARQAWNTIWRRLDRHNKTILNSLAREKSIRNGKI